MLAYFRQAWRLLRESPVLGVVSVLGTALAIGLITLTFASQRLIPEGDFYPAYKRHRMLFWNSVQIRNDEKNSSSSSAVGLRLAKLFAEIPSAEAVAISERFSDTYGFRRTGEPHERQRYILGTCADFFKVYDFEFLAGVPYTKEEVEAGARVMVIGEQVAREFFGTEAVVGKELLVDFKPMRIVGIVKDVSSYLSSVTANAWMPYSLSNSVKYGSDLRGSLKVDFLAHSPEEFPVLRKEISEVISKIDAEIAPDYISPNEQPDELHAAIHRLWSNVGPDMKSIDRQFYVTLLILFLIPGLNLIVISHARMRRRLQELGLRKAFGGTVVDILWQVVRESVFYTLLGAILGLFILLLATYGLQSLFFESVTWAAEGLDFSIPLSTVFSWRVILAAILSSLVLNVVSMLIPARQMARRDIVYSLSSKR